MLCSVVSWQKKGRNIVNGIHNLWFEILFWNFGGGTGKPWKALGDLVFGLKFETKPFCIRNSTVDCMFGNSLYIIYYQCLCELGCLHLWQVLKTLCQTLTKSDIRGSNSGVDLDSSFWNMPCTTHDGFVSQKTWIFTSQIHFYLDSLKELSRSLRVFWGVFCKMFTNGSFSMFNRWEAENTYWTRCGLEVFAI